MKIKNTSKITASFPHGVVLKPGVNDDVDDAAWAKLKEHPHVIAKINAKVFVELAAPAAPKSEAKPDDKAPKKKPSPPAPPAVG